MQATEAVFRGLPPSIVGAGGLASGYNAYVYQQLLREAASVSEQSEAIIELANPLLGDD